MNFVSKGVENFVGFESFNLQVIHSRDFAVKVVKLVVIRHTSGDGSHHISRL